jgi:predicted SAM-dependent methyltransferase
MVEKFKEKGYKILGVDKYYKSKSILQADILTLPFEDNSFDYILFLDVIEHLFYPEQLIAVKELKRVLKPGGKIILSVPNLAHLASRISFFFKGKLSRTANIHKHPGDRPAEEYIQIFNEISLNVEKRIGIELSLGSLFKKYLKKLISKVLYEKLFFASIYNPNLCFLNIFILNNSKK